MHLRTLTAFSLGSLLVLSIWHYRQVAHSQPSGGPSATPTVAALPAPQAVAALARLQPADEVVQLQAPAARQQDRIARWFVAEGQVVEVGQLLARTDGARRLDQEVELARARVRLAESRLGQVLAGPKSGEVQRQSGELRRLEAELRRQRGIQQASISRWATEEDLLGKNYARFQELYRQGACSALELEQRQLAWESARRQHQQVQAEWLRLQDTLRAQLDSARGELERIREVRPSDVATARAEVEQAQAELRRAEVEREECEIRSPLPGRVLKIHARRGERIDAEKGLAELTGGLQMVAVAEVYQDDVQRLQPQQRCTLTSPALPSPLQGRIERLGQRVQRQHVFGDEPGEKFDQRVVEVRVMLDRPSNKLAADWTHLQLQARFEP